MSSVWNPDNVRDVAESVGIASLADNVVEELARDVDFRLAQVLEEAMKFMLLAAENASLPSES